MVLQWVMDLTPPSKYTVASGANSRMRHAQRRRRVAFFGLRPRRRLAKGRSCAIRVLAAERTDGPSQRRRVASTRIAASGRHERLTRTLPASRQQVPHYAGLPRNAQMAGTHCCYGAYMQRSLWLGRLKKRLPWMTEVLSSLHVINATSPKLMLG